jgi:hypothetical protein
MGTSEPFSKFAFVVTPAVVARIPETQPWRQTLAAHNRTILYTFRGDFMGGIAERPWE